MRSRRNSTSANAPAGSSPWMAAKMPMRIGSLLFGPRKTNRGMPCCSPAESNASIPVSRRGCPVIGCRSSRRQRRPFTRANGVGSRPAESDSLAAFELKHRFSHRYTNNLAPISAQNQFREMPAVRCLAFLTSCQPVQAQTLRQLCRLNLGASLELGCWTLGASIHLDVCTGLVTGSPPVRRCRARGGSGCRR